MKDNEVISINKELFYELQNKLISAVELHYVKKHKAALPYLDTPSKYVKFYKLTGFVKKDMHVESQISLITHEIGEYIFHRHEEINSKTNENDGEIKSLSKEDKAIQAQLFTHIALEGLGVDSESEHSLKYVSPYLLVDGNKKEALNIFDIDKGVLNAHLSIVIPGVNKFNRILLQEEFLEKEIKQLQEFMPDKYIFDNATNKANVILNELSDLLKKDREKEIIAIEDRKINIKNELNSKLIERNVGQRIA